MAHAMQEHINFLNTNRLVVEFLNPQSSFAAVSSVSAWRAANRLILYGYGVGSGENREVGAAAYQIEERKTETPPPTKDQRYPGSSAPLLIFFSSMPPVPCMPVSIMGRISVQDILVVKADATLSVHLDLIPEREKHMWLEEVEDDRVTRFVEMMRSGEIFKPEDFPGGDRRFWVPEATINKCRKRKANEDNQGPSKFQFSGGKRTRSLIRMAKKKKPTASSPGRKKHSYALRSGDGNDTSEVVHPSDHELS
ncbi:unnamed protein product [Brassica oleracea]|uniref:(rape) hypothetical protein n=1 Tax=Brassica napus TaxID=3708 RepID=A0A816IGF7_BRANA|nr:unnamed protein product [Brassica napus]